MAGGKVELPAQGWKPRWYQLPLWKYMEQGGRRAVLCWPRRHGKDYVCINWCAIATQLRVGQYYYVMPYQNQARRIVWAGMDKMGKRFIDAFPRALIKSKLESEMRLTLKNGSIFQVLGGDDPDKLVGANPVGVVFSEYALTNPLCWKLIAPILAENGGWVIFNSTPRGNNHFRDMLDEAKRDKENWYWSHETAKTLKVLTPEDLRQLRRDLKDEALFQQEAFCSFSAPMQGAYYDTQMKFLAKNKRIGRVPPDPNLEIHTAWDLGMDDATTIWFFQQYQQEIRLVHYYEDSGEGLSHYIDYARTLIRKFGCVNGQNYAPHDINVRELGSGKSRLEQAKQLGMEFELVPKHSIEDGINEVRSVLYRCYFDHDECYQGLSCLRSYRKEFDPMKNVYKMRPLHDWSSHGADGFRTLAMGLRRKPKAQKPPQEVAISNYDPLS